MLEPLEDWTERLLNLPPVGTAQLGALNLANLYGDSADKVTAEGSGPLFTFNRPLFVTTLLALGFIPTATTNWVPKVGTAFLAGVLAAIIKPSQKKDARWTASITDTLTPPLGAVVITTAVKAKTTLEAGLLDAVKGFSEITDSSQSAAFQDSLSKAFRDATLEFEFKLIGLRVIPGPATEPLILTFKAQ